MIQVDSDLGHCSRRAAEQEVGGGSDLDHDDDDDVDEDEEFTCCTGKRGCGVVGGDGAILAFLNSAMDFRL